MDRYFNKRTGAEVEAVQLTSANVGVVKEWCNAKEVVEHDALEPDKRFVALNLDTLDGRQRVTEMDYVIKDGNGNFHGASPAGFNYRFEKF